MADTDPVTFNRALLAALGIDEREPVTGIDIKCRPGRFPRVAVTKKLLTDGVPAVFATVEWEYRPVEGPVDVTRVTDRAPRLEVVDDA